MAAAAKLRGNVNGGKDTFNTSGGLASRGGGTISMLDNSLEDRYQRVVQENHQLKLQRNELQDKLKDLTTKFRKLIRDLKLGVDVETALLNPQVSSASLPNLGSTNKVPSSASLDQPTSTASIMLEAVTRERDALQLQLRQYQQNAIASALSTGYPPAMQQPQNNFTAPPTQQQSADGSNHILSLQERIAIQELQASQALDRQRLEQAQKEITRLQILVQQEMSIRMQLQQQAGLSSPAADANAVQRAASIQQQEEMRNMRIQMQQLQTEALQSKSTVEHLCRERDTLQLQLKLFKDQQASDNGDPTKGAAVDPMTLLEFQRDLQTKSSQMTVLSNRFQFAQSQVSTLKNECERLINELRLLHQQHSEVKKQLFDQENEKAALRLKCERLNEVEAQLYTKQDELLRTEQQLLKTVERVQTVSRDTEMAVRREVATRLAEAEQSRDESERIRRSKETALVETEQQLSEWRRKIDALSEELKQKNVELQKERDERKELAARNALLTGVTGDLGEEVHKAVALATMRTRLEKQQQPPGHAGQGILDMWEGLEWNEGWEASKLRETVAASTLELELAEGRMTQLVSQNSELQSRLKDIVVERDVLFDENVSLRRRITGVQTSLAKRQLEQYRKQVASGKQNVGIMRVRLRHVQTLSSSAFVGAGSYFFTLDSVLPSYETLVSSVFHSIADEELSIDFVFDALSIDEVTVAALRAARFEFQLHRCTAQESSEIIAFGEWSAEQLVVESADCGGCVSNVVLQLHSPTSGEAMSTLVFDVDTENLILPVLLGAPLHSNLDAQYVNKVVYSLRSVVAIRIQVFQLHNVPTSVSPYVFYTSSLVANGQQSSPIQDTVVEPAQRMSSWLQLQLPSVAAGGSLGTAAVSAEPTSAAATGSNNTSIASASAASVFSPLMESVPVDHKMILNARNIHAIYDGAVVFVVFDRQAKDVERHLGMASLPLKPLLDSASASLITKLPLSPSQALIEVGISWCQNAFA